MHHINQRPHGAGRVQRQHEQMQQQQQFTADLVALARSMLLLDLCPQLLAVCASPHCHAVMPRASALRKNLQKYRLVLQTVTLIPASAPDVTNCQMWLRQAEPTAQRDAASQTRAAQRVQRRVPQSQQQGDGGIGDFFKGDLPKKLVVMLVWTRRRCLLSAPNPPPLFCSVVHQDVRSAMHSGPAAAATAFQPQRATPFLRSDSDNCV